MVRKVLVSLTLALLVQQFESALKCSPKKSRTTLPLSTVSSVPSQSYEVTVPSSSATPSSSYVVSVSVPSVTPSSSQVEVYPNYPVVSSTSSASAPNSTYVVSSTSTSNYIVSSSSSAISSSNYVVSSSSSVISSSSNVISSSSFVVSSSSSEVSSQVPTSTSSSAAVTSSAPVPPASGDYLIKGLTYSPYTVDGCASKAKVTSDINNILKYARQIRLYGTDCNQIDYVLQAIVESKIECKVLLGIWIRDGPQRFQKELSDVITALKNPSYNRLISGVTVGNEEIINGQSDVTVIEKLQSVRAALKSNGLGQFQVSTVEVFNKWTSSLAEHSDIIYANIYSYFTPVYGDAKIETSVTGMFKELEVLKQKFNKQIAISECGWPSYGTSSIPTFKPASLENQCEFLTSFICQAKKLGTNYFVLEAFDAKWKKGDSCEQNFGVLNNDGSLKCKSLQSC